MNWNTPSPADQQQFPPQTVYEAGLRHHHIANTAYPIHHSSTMRPYRLAVSTAFHRTHSTSDPAQQAALATWQGTDRMGLYIHVPFCAARCKYCEYTVVERPDRQAEDDYFEALLGELAMYRRQIGPKTLVGFDIGGGTPAFAGIENLRRTVEAVREAFHWPTSMCASIETTPIIADREPEKMAALHTIGFDRISMGVQTTHFKLARSLGREYEGMSMLQSAVQHIRQAGFRRFNIDLMYGFADQTLPDWRDTVTQTIALQPEYITLYQMRYKGTRMQAQATQVGHEQVYAQEQAAHELLLSAGYAGSPGKNTYSRLPADPGTSDYLSERVVSGTPYLGLGLGAQTFSPYTLSYNLGAASKTLPPYLEAIQAGRLPVQDLYHLPLQAAMAKMISVSFYFGEIHLARFQARFGLPLDQAFAAETRFVLDEGLMEYIGALPDTRLRLTLKGLRHKSGVIALFYSGAVKEYLIGLQNGWDE